MTQAEFKALLKLEGLSLEVIEYKDYFWIGRIKRIDTDQTICSCSEKTRGATIKMLIDTYYHANN